MAYEVPENVMRALIKGLLDAVDGTNATSDDDALLETFTTTLDEHDAEMPDDMRARLVRLAHIRKDFMAACRAFDREHAAGNTAAADEWLTELNRLRKKSKEMSAFLKFPLAAEALSKAKEFDEFCALLPNVDLNTLYGSEHYGKVSPLPLIWALSARQKPLERVQLMLAAGARVDLATGMGTTVLHQMAGMNRKAAIRLPILRLLVFKGADLEAKSLHDQTPLTIAIQGGSAEDVGFFLTAGSKVRLKDMKYATQDPKKLKALLAHLSGDTDRLQEAAGLGGWLRGEIKHLELRSKKAIRDGAKGDFHRKVEDNLRQSLALLADLPGYKSTDVTRKVTWKEEPSAFWAIHGAETLDAYRSALARVDITTFYMPGTHPIYWPIEAKDCRPERLWLMLSAGASVEGGKNGTALHIFAQECRKNAAEQFRMAQMLVQAGANLEARNYNDRTPLVCAVEWEGYAEAVALLKLGASPKMTLSSRRLYGDRYEAPLIFAAADDVRIFKCMLEFGADRNASDSDGNTLRTFIQQEIARLTKMRQEDASGNIKRRIDRSINNFKKSLKLIDAKP